MATDPQTCLVLWDLDHTLIETRGVGRAIYERVFPAVTGQPLRTLVAVHGRTELDIMHDTLQLHGIGADEDTVRRLATALAEGYRAAISELVERGRVLPGARAALELLANDPEIRQSVLTGNTTEIARIKVEAFDLDQYLDLTIGAYGDDDRERVRLVSIARKRASERLDIPIDAHQVVIIGDTPNDMNAAIGAGAHAVGVATGRYSVQELQAAGATSSLPSLTDLPRLRQALATR